MESKKNFIIGGIIVLALIIFVVLQYGGGEFFKGQILKGGVVDPEIARQEAEQGLKPDLKAGLKVVSSPLDGDMVVSASIENAGDGTILGNTPFEYAIFVNGDEVFSNTDSYTSMDSGDAFSFEYSISKAIYNYADSGKIKFVIDTGNSIVESDEDNNEAEVKYELN